MAVTQRDRAWVEVNREALHRNLEVLRARLPENCRLMPVLKANAYGHGAAVTAKALAQMGVTSFCVACAAEGVDLRQQGISGEILILGYTPASQFPLLHRYRLTQTVVDTSHAVQLSQFGRKLRVQVSIDTGMHRLGVGSGQLEQLFRIFQLPNLEITGIFTHLCAEDLDSQEARTFTFRQAEEFYTVVNALKGWGFFPKAHLLSSYGILNYPELAGDYARIGIALYGVLSTQQDAAKSPVHLQPVLSLKARIASVREVPSGEHVGYGLQFAANRTAKIATLTIGYADGLPRALSCGVGSVLIHGRKAPIAGCICMDQTMIDVTDIPDVHPGDIAVLIGASGSQRITAYDWASQAHTITNEILSRLGPRLERILV